MLEVAGRLEGGHLVADRRRGDADPGASTSVLEPTGRPVATYSRTTRRRIIRCRSDSGLSSRLRVTSVGGTIRLFAHHRLLREV